MSLTSIDLGLAELFADPKRRQAFFRAITQDEIACRIRELRKERGLNQTEFAAKANMKQSAVSRIEQSDYAAWNLSTLFRVADALDARVRVIIEKAEDAVTEFLDTESDDDVVQSDGVEDLYSVAPPSFGNVTPITDPSLQKKGGVESPFRQPNVNDFGSWYRKLSDTKLQRFDPFAQRREIDSEANL